MNKIKIKFSYVILVAALSVATCAAYFSVSGLSQLFAGASMAVIIMASILEIGKVLATTALHKYWNKLGKGLRFYLTVSVIVLMLITSAGIYGFLSNGYQSTANKLEIHDGELGVLDGKKTLFSDNVIANNKIIESKNKRIDQLSGLRNTQETRIDGSTSVSGQRNVRNDINSSNVEIQKLSSEIDVLNSKNSSLNDSISKYNSAALKLKSNSKIAGEVGPLKYIAALTGAPMASIVNYLILLLIFVFDPLAIALILVYNKLFALENEEINKIVEKPNVYPEMEVVDIFPNPPSPIHMENDLVLPDEQFDDAELIEEEPILEPEIIEQISEPVQEVVAEPIKPKITVEELREANRGFSRRIPPNQTNSIERIGSNKVTKNGDNNKFIYKRNQ